MDSCLFCKIIRREWPTEVIAENEYALAFRDLHPVAPAHALVIPKAHVQGIGHAEPKDAHLLGETLLLANEVATTLDIHKTGYRLVINNGEHAGQSVMHLHVHVLGGRPLAWPPG